MTTGSSSADTRGRALTERLGLTILGTEGHDIKVPCVSCQSSDAGRIHSETGVYFCYSCNRALNAFDLCKVVLRDHVAAKRLMHEVGLFPQLFESGRKVNDTRALADTHAQADKHPEQGLQSTGDSGKAETSVDIIDVTARKKGTTKAGFLAYGAAARGTRIVFPTFRLDSLDGKAKAEMISSFTIDLDSEDPRYHKGMNEWNRDAGCFLPCTRKPGKVTVSLPTPGETWITTEGPKNAAAYATFGYKAVGLNGKHVKKEFLPGFIAAFKDVDVILAPDGDNASNLFAMGELLDSVGQVFEDCGATLVLLHHSPKHIPPGDPLQLDNLAFAGFAEFAAGWILLNRHPRHSRAP